MQKLDAIELFVRVAELRSFTKAAEERLLPRNTASRLVRELEDDLGVQLLIRTTRTVRLTEAGEAYLERARDALEALYAAGDQASEYSKKPKGRLRVAAPVSFSVRYLAPVLSSFRAKYPDIIVDLQLADRVVDVVEEGFDVALRIGQLPDSSLKARRLGAIRRILVASPSYLERSDPISDPVDLCGHQCLSYSYMSERADWRLIGVKGETNVTVQSSVTANNGDVLAELAVAGSGIINTLTLIAAPYLSDGRLVRVLPSWEPPGTELHAVYPDGRRLPPKVRVFIDMLVDAYSDAPPWDRELAVD